MNLGRISLSTLFLLGVFAASSRAQDSLSVLWSDAPGSQTWLSSANNDERGMAFNSVTGNLYVVNKTATSVEIVNGGTGAGTGTLNVTGVTGGTFALDSVGVASDGTIYIANLTTASTTSPFKVYSWASEAAAPTVAYSGDPGAGTSLRYGDDLRVSGSGTGTVILAGSGSGTTSTVGYLTTANGTSFSSVKLTIAGTGGTDMSKGIAFGPGGTIYGRTTSTALRQINTSGTLLNSYTLNSIGGSVGPIAYDPVHNLLAGMEVSSGTGAGTERINIYDVSTFTTSGGNQPIYSFALPTDNANGNAVGALDWSADGDTLYALDSNNGLFALTLVPEPGTMTLLTLGAGAMGAAWLRRRARK
jgi:hypothetical protein